MPFTIIGNESIAPSSETTKTTAVSELEQTSPEGTTTGTSESGTSTVTPTTETTTTTQPSVPNILSSGTQWGNQQRNLDQDTALYLMKSLLNKAIISKAN